MANENEERQRKELQSFVTEVAKWSPVQRAVAVHLMGELQGAIDSAIARVHPIRSAVAPQKAGRKRRRSW